MKDTDIGQDLRTTGTTAHAKGNLDVAKAAYAQYLARHPNDAVIWSNLGALHRTQARHQLALRAHDRAVALAPDLRSVLNNAANSYSDCGRYDDSIALRLRILENDPDDLNQLALIGRCLRGQGEYAQAIAWLKQILARHPKDPELHMQLAFAQLAAGQYVDGFRSYRWRWRAGELAPRDLVVPEWQGEDLTGKTILVLPEQGFGDAILFSRFLPVLKQRGARVLILLKQPLRRLMAGIDGVDGIVDAMPESGRVDCYVNMMDLALVHFRSSGQVPAPARLSVPRDSHARATSILAPYPKTLNVGVVWTGSVTYKGNAFRSPSHTTLLPLTDVPGVQLFSLYKGPESGAYHADGTDAFILDAGNDDRDFADTAAMMQGLDLVITSDTATAHLAGSLGVPVWVVLHWDPFWVYRHTGETTDWYPGMRLFRQRTPMDWDGVMAKVTHALRIRENEDE